MCSSPVGGGAGEEKSAGNGTDMYGQEEKEEEKVVVVVFTREGRALVVPTLKFVWNPPKPIVTAPTPTHDGCRCHVCRPLLGGHASLSDEEDEAICGGGTRTSTRGHTRRFLTSIRLDNIDDEDAGPG